MTPEQIKAYYTDAKVAALEAAFARVRPAENWKMPIDVTIDEVNDEEQAVIAEAIAFYTGSVATFTPVMGFKVRVQAAGYYATIGA